LFLVVFINDLTNVCCGNAKLVLFADDAKFYIVINVNALSCDLQQSLNSLCSWSVDWQLFINILKCHCFSLCLRSNTVFNRSYSIDNTVLDFLNSVNDLGVEFDSHLEFTNHISTIVAKASQRSAVFFKGFVTRNLSIIRKAFVTYIRPCLEYNSVIWSPTKIYLIDKIEAVQRHFTKRIPCLSHLSYNDRLRKIHVDTLELRRLRFDLIQYYKIINNLTPFLPTDFFTFYDPRSSSRLSTPYLLPNKAAVTQQISSLFMYRTINCFNSLPQNVKNASSLPHFKQLIASIDFSSFLHGSIYK
jgi:hypothetical protein